MKSRGRKPQVEAINSAIDEDDPRLVFADGREFVLVVLNILFELVECAQEAQVCLELCHINKGCYPVLANVECRRKFRRVVMIRRRRDASRVVSGRGIGHDGLAVE